MKLYALYDVKADAYTNFVAEKSDAVASRQFAEAVTQPNSVLGKYADDFVLVCLGAVPESVDGEDESTIGRFNHDIVLSARQVMDLQASGPSLVKEA